MTNPSTKTITRFGNIPSGAGGQRLPFSPAVRAGDFVFCSGHVAMKDNGEVKKVLALAGCSLEDVVKVCVWLDDTRDFWTFNRIYTEYFGDHAPARSCVQSAMMVDCKVEIEVTAYKPL
ncbi:MAG: RidA family protein [Burkholderiales bacterium]|nr:RidA family protein [Burkholderiales bacterium]